MTLSPRDFDIRQIDSGAVDFSTPVQISRRLRGAFPEPGPESAPAEETRLRLIADAVIAANLFKHPELPRWAWMLQDLVQDTGAVSTSPPVALAGGLTYMRLEQWLVALLPPICSGRQADLAVADLSKLMSQCDGIRHWVLDMAAVSALEPSLAGYLIGFNHGLQATACDLALLWMPQSSVPPSLQSPLIKHFSLITKGLFFLSETRQ